MWLVSDTRSSCDIADYLSDRCVEAVEVIVIDDVSSDQTGAASAPEEESRRLVFIFTTVGRGFEKTSYPQAIDSVIHRSLRQISF